MELITFSNQFTSPVLYQQERIESTTVVLLAVVYMVLKLLQN